MLKEFDKYRTDSKCQSRNLPQVPLIQIVLFVHYALIHFWLRKVLMVSVILMFIKY